MYGETSGEGTGAGDLPPWRAVVESSPSTSVDSGTNGSGGSMSQSSVAPSADSSAGAGVVAISGSSPGATGDTSPTMPGAGIATASSSDSGDASITSTGTTVVESTATFTQDGNLSLNARAIGSSGGPFAFAGDVSADGGSVSGGGAYLAQAVSVDIVATASESPPIFDPEQPAMLPLQNSAEADGLETELKELFIQLFEDNLRADERFVNLLGMPQLGPRELIETSLANDGLSIYRGAQNASGAGAYLLRAWRAMNPKRGTHLLETYLQLLWPNVWTSDQMWQSKASGSTYPNQLVTADGGNHYLTSRVNVSLPARVTSGGDLNSIQAGLRASVPARIVLNISVVSEDNFGIGIAAVYSPGLVAQSYEGAIAA